MNGRQWLIVVVVLTAIAAGYFYVAPTRETTDQSGDQSLPRKSEKQETTPDTTIVTSETPDYRSRRARVIRVYDGDSLKVRFLDSHERGEIRIKGIDCPETSEEVDKCGKPGVVNLPCDEEVPLGIRAKSYARTLLQDEIVTLESYNDFDRGNYGRILAYVRTREGEDYGLKTIKKGYCNDSGRKYDHPRAQHYELYRRPLQR